MLQLAVLALAQLDVATYLAGNPMNPTEVMLVDVDLDGRLDLVVRGSASEGFGVALGEASGSFGPLTQQVVDTFWPGRGQGPSIAALDIDLDGDVDFVFGAYSGELVLVLRDSDGGVEQVVQMDDLNARATSVHILDVTADGLPDVVVGTLDAARSSVYRQLPGGTFGAGERLVVGADVEAGVLHFADVDGDGDIDALGAGAAASTLSGSGLVLFRNTNGIPFSPSDVSLVRGGMNDLDMADVDGDGDLDVVTCAGTINRDAFLLSNDGLGHFGAAATLATTARFLLDLHFADVDADGDLDVVTLRERLVNRDEIGLFRNEGGGVWSEQLEPMFDDNPDAFDLADLDGDGTVDAVTGEGHPTIDFSHARIDVSHGVAGAGGRIFELSQELVARHATQPIQVMDANGDGHDDLLVVGSDAGPISNGSVACRLALPGGGFGATLGIVETGSWAIPPTGGDFDGDGHVDVTVVDLGGEILTAFGRGDGSFEAAVPSLAASPALTHWLGTADVNADGIDDLVLTTGNSARVLYALGHPSRQFSGLTNLPDGAFSQVVEVRPDDLDGDGLVDFIYAVGSDVVWSRNESGGTFATRATIAAFPGAAGYELPVPQVADVDGDGLRDLAVVGPQGDLLWSRALGSGSFAAPVALPLPPDTLMRTLVLDVDFDGDGDVIADTAPTSGVRALVVSENLGGAAFGPYEPLGASYFRGSCSLTPIDHDADGDPDILIGGKNARFSLARNRWSSDLGERYCAPAIPNSSGRAGRIGAIGSIDLTRNELRLDAWSLPANSFGYFLVAPQRDSVIGLPNSVGRLCLGGSVGRFTAPGQVLDSGPAGTFFLEVDVGGIPTPQLGLVPVQPGETWHFQAWHRDAVSGAVTSNFTDGLSVTF